MPGDPAEQVLGGHAAILEVDLDDRHAADAHLVLDFPIPKPGVPFSTMIARMRRDFESGSVTAKTV